MPSRDDKLLLKAVRREAVPRRPLWIMRQAGRYLPEYREFRKKHSFKALAGQPELFMENQLVLIREGVREVAPAMAAALNGIKDADIRALARHFAALKPPPPAGKPDAATARRAREVSRKAHCGSCHLPDFSGRDQIPRLAGQREEYLLEAMRAYRDNRRSGGDTIMAASLYGIADADLQVLARFLARLP